jgi:hypothetical protein
MYKNQIGMIGKEMEYRLEYVTDENELQREKIARNVLLL